MLGFVAILPSLARRASVVSAFVLAGACMALADAVPRGLPPDPWCPCVPNAQNFGYFQTRWREWPGERRVDEIFNKSAPAEKMATPPGQELIPLPRATPASKKATEPGGNLLPNPEKKPEKKPEQKPETPSETIKEKPGGIPKEQEPAEKTTPSPNSVPTEPGIPSEPPPSKEPRLEGGLDNPPAEKGSGPADKGSGPADKGSGPADKVPSPILPKTQPRDDKSASPEPILPKKKKADAESAKPADQGSTRPQDATQAGLTQFDPSDGGQVLQSVWTPALGVDVHGQSAGVEPTSYDEPARSEEARAALGGFCPVELHDLGKWVPGSMRWGAVYRGQTYLCAGPDQRDRFLASPGRYAPMDGGNDVVWAAQRNRVVPGKTENTVLYHGRLYLFASSGSLEQFRQNPRRYADAAR
ncbi:MAG: YHS domain-containing protein [Thermoguttaceae bacterium]